MAYKDGFYIKLVFGEKVKIAGPYPIACRNMAKMVNNEISQLRRLADSSIRYAHAVKNSRYARLWFYGEDGMPEKLKSNSLFAYVDGIRYQSG